MYDIAHKWDQPFETLRLTVLRMPPDREEELLGVS
jgi:hypothetical protein